MRNCAKNIIITGASRGIGRALTEKFLNEGHSVFVVSRNEEKLKEIAQIHTDKDFRYAPLDLSQPEDYENIHDYIYDWTKIDAVYNNAGVLIKKDFADLSADDFMESWKVNFLAPAMLIQSLMSKFTPDTHIINVSTMGAVQGTVKFPGLTAYATSKAALVNLTEMLAEEFKDKGFKVNCIALGAVQTEMLAEAFPEYKAPVSPEELAEYLFDFGLNAHRFQNGKIVELSLTTP